MPAPKQQFDTLAVVGVGLIGGSIALAARQRGIYKKVIGFGRNRERLQGAIDLKIIDDARSELSDFSGVDLAVVCTPVDRIAADVEQILTHSPESTIVTDAGSVKAGICGHLKGNTKAIERFVGSHPLAGSHRSGFENAEADLFVNRNCVLTPYCESPSDLVEKVRTFWSSLGMRLHSMSASEHDHILAITSHLPHLGASAIASLIDEKSVDFAASGFRDTTRVAGGDPGLWTAIFSDNASEVISATDQLIKVLQHYRDALANQDRKILFELLEKGQRSRELFEKRHQQKSDS